jgi:hypothetical protein
MLNLIKIRSVAAELYADGRTDGRTDGLSDGRDEAFVNFANALNKWSL